jgi:hypothetical protein
VKSTKWQQLLRMISKLCSLISLDVLSVDLGLEGLWTLVEEVVFLNIVVRSWSFFLKRQFLEKSDK